MNMLQRTIARPGQARPEHLLAVSRTYGNQAVMRLVEKARLERLGQVSPATATIQRIPTQNTGGNLAIVQRDDELDTDQIEMGQNESQEETEEGDVPDQEVEQKRKEIMKKLKKEKRKRGFLMLAKMPVRLFKELLILPVRVIDQLSVVDLHLKDAVKYFGDKKTRKQRLDKTDDGLKKQQGTAKRAFGRTGITGYLHGYKSHKMMYTDSNDSDFIKGLSSKYNPLNALNNVGGKQTRDSKTKINQLENELKLLDNPETNVIKSNLNWD
ncbi:MAG: hypothetical protein BGO39_21750 [Chloroflexi bacterium 54-19]|nr:MAG: hypothetical protein BGO39_21750 [Chloroflexi bacterium 54-19]